MGIQYKCTTTIPQMSQKGVISTHNSQNYNDHISDETDSPWAGKKRKIDIFKETFMEMEVENKLWVEHDE